MSQTIRIPSSSQPQKQPNHWHSLFLSVTYLPSHFSSLKGSVRGLALQELEVAPLSGIWTHLSSVKEDISCPLSPILTKTFPWLFVFFPPNGSSNHQVEEINSCSSFCLHVSQPSGRPLRSTHESTVAAHVQALMVFISNIPHRPLYFYCFSP